MKRSEEIKDNKQAYYVENGIRYFNPKRGLGFNFLLGSPEGKSVNYSNVNYGNFARKFELNYEL
jgi:hypothetical protein